MLFSSRSKSAILTTPQKSKHEKLNKLLHGLNQDWGLSLPIRDRNWSPSQLSNTLQDRCVEHIKFLFFSSPAELNNLMEEFANQVRRTSHSDPMSVLMELLLPVVWSRQPKRKEAKTLVQSLEAQPLGEDQPTTISSPVSVTTRTDGFIVRRPSTPETFTTPPESPSLSPSVSASQRREVRSEQSRKRRPDGGTDQLESPHKPKYNRAADGRRASETGSVVDFSTAPPIPGSSSRSKFKTSFTSTLADSRAGPSGLTTANTSFGADIAAAETFDTPFSSWSSELNERRLPLLLATQDQSEHMSPNVAIDQPTSSYPGSSAFAAFDEHLRFESDAPATRPTNVPLPTSGPAVAREITSIVNKALDDTSTPKSDVSEHFQVRDLPNQGLFSNCELRSGAAGLPFRVVYECARLAMANDINVRDILPQSKESIDNYDDLLSVIKRRSRRPEFKVVQRVKPQAWDNSSPTKAFTGVSLKANLTLTYEPNKPMFRLALETLRMEKSCRFQRAWGGDRFLYLTIPNLDRLAGYLGDQKAHISRRFIEWFLRDKWFLGRLWGCCHIEPIKSKKALDRIEQPSFRVVLFAMEGHDIPKSRELSVEGLIGWFLPMSKSEHQSYCKIFARLDLGFSRTISTVSFLPSQILRVSDIYADGQPEATDFDDPCEDWTISRAPRDVSKVSMNDGCARISLGACRLIRDVLGLRGPMPSAFQGRIGGAKGVWIRSAENDSKSEEDLRVWIEVNDSQLKFEFHDVDLNDKEPFDQIRLTFDLVQYTRCPPPSSLYLGFIPILQDRGVKLTNVIQLTTDFFKLETEQLMDAMQDSYLCKRWFHKNFSDNEEKQREGGLEWHAGLPCSKVQIIGLLLDSGFKPTQLSYLGNLILEMVEMHFTNLTKSLRIELPKSATVMGISDPIGVLRPGEIHLIFSRAFVNEITGDCDPSLDQKEVVVARHPNLRKSDMQKVCARNKPELSHLVDVVVFSSQGCIPLAQKLQGGDYDGDVFWLCWDERITDHFMNAAAPLTLPPPEDFGIKVDRQSFGEILAGPGPIQTFLAKSFHFRWQPSILGLCTILHENLAYAENSVDSPGVNVIADLHDHMIDAAKSGYIMDMNSYRQFVDPYSRTATGNFLKTPAYKQALKVGFEGTIRRLHGERSLIESVAKYKKDHAVDSLFFEIIQPQIIDSLKLLGSFVTKSEDVVDVELCRLYEEYAVDPHERVRKEIEILTECFATTIRNAWNHTTHRKDLKRQDVGKAILEIYESYTALQPMDLTCPKISSWTATRFDQEYSTWSLIKASTLYSLYGQKKALMVFRMAGKELAYMKAMNCPGIRQIIEPIWANLKPGKQRAVKPGEKLPHLGSETATGAESETETAEVDEEDFYSPLEIMD